MMIAAEQGDVLSRINLGVAFLHGEGVEPDQDKAVYWPKPAAATGNSDAQYILGACYHGTIGRQELEEAVYWFKLAAEQGYDRAQIDLGLSYAQGRGIEKDFEKAVYFFRLAAEQGCSDGQFYLGKAYKLGDGIEQDAELAVYWFKLSAEQGDSEAQLWLAIYYVTGEGVEEDRALGLNYMKLSAENGNSIAQVYFKRKADEKGDPKVVEFPNQKLNSDQWLQTMIQQFEAGPPELKASFLASIGAPVHVFNQSLSKLVETDENQEIEFNETFSAPT